MIEDTRKLLIHRPFSVDLYVK